ncbi:hypothetical protein AB6E04_00935 [Vibrio amylolyticus]|uniref:hypothetical protein n=1 Tax=Vibrio amylolyticus TaxID=2847292 RepID=UPI00354DA9B4
MRLFILAMPFVLLFSHCAHSSEHWTGEVKWVNVDENCSAYIFIDNPRSGTSGETFGCGNHNIVYLGKKGLPANSAFLSQALMVYSSQKTVRFGVRRVSGHCETSYLSAR